MDRSRCTYCLGLCCLFNDATPNEAYTAGHTLSLHDAHPICLTHSCGLKGALGRHVSARRPACTPSQLTPRSAHSARSETLPLTTPMEPVRVPGWATMRSAAAAPK